MDTLGLAPLPADVPDLEPGPTKTAGVGDPALVLLARFLAAAINADCAAAFERIMGPLPPLRDVGTGHTGLLRGAVRNVLLLDPRLGRGFVEADTPILFVYRARDNKGWVRASESLQQRLSSVVVQWYGGGVRNDDRINRDPFHTMISTAIGHAVHFGRHPAWVHPFDEILPDALMFPRAAPPSDTTFEGTDLDGPLATATLKVARPVLVSTAVAPGAYDTAAPIRVRGLDERGRAWSDTVTPTDADGGEALFTVWPFTKVLAVDSPAQGPGAKIHVGYAPAPDVLQLGSVIGQHARFMYLTVARDGEPKRITVKPQMNPVNAVERGVPPLSYELEVYELTLSVTENIVPDPLVHAGPMVTGAGTFVLPKADNQVTAEMALFVP